MDARIRVSLEFRISENGLEDALDEYDVLSVEGLISEIVDKSVACDEIVAKVTEGPNNLEEYDAQQATG